MYAGRGNNAQTHYRREYRQEVDRMIDFSAWVPWICQ